MLIAGIHNAATCVLDILTDDFCEVVYGETGVAQLVDFRFNDDLLDVPAIGIDLSDTGNSSQLRLNHVFLCFPQRHQLCFARGRSVRSVRSVVDGVIKYFAQPGRNRDELRRKARR